jgi:hypothetical protein
MSDRAFAEEEFRGVDLGDARRDARLTAMAAGMAAKPAGKVTETFHESSARQGAFKLLENRAADPNEVIRASARAGFARVLNEDVVIVPIDQTTLTLSAVPQDSEMGPVGNRWSHDLGAHAMNAIIVTAEGVTMGSAGQVYWVRERQEQASRTKTHGAGKKLPRVIKAANRPIGEKETVHWGSAMELALSCAKDSGFGGKIWFQLDAGADFAHLLASATLLNAGVTVRTKRDRRLFEESGLLIDKVLDAAPVGSYVIEVPETNNRPGRSATLEVRYVQVVLQLNPRGDGGTVPAPLFAVHAREVSEVPKGAAALDWLLLTNVPGSSLKDAKRVIRAYATRWRIEEVHKAWKSVTKVEESGLHSLHAFSMWAAVLYAVAIRIERLKYLARVAPESAATSELNANEVAMLLKLRKQASTTVLNIGTAVRWIADLGGYMNPHQGPPGTITLARGLRELRSLVRGAEM